MDRSPGYSSFADQSRRPVFNPHLALQRIGGDGHLLRSLASFYIDDAPALLAQLRAGLEHQECDAVMHAAHTIKALSANLDSHETVAIAGIIERSARAHDMQLAMQLMDDLATAVDAVIQGLKGYYSDLGSEPS